MSPKKKPAAQLGPPRAARSRMYTLEVRLLGGPMSEKFVQKNPVVSRTMQMLGDQTLVDLHYAIFDAFGRDDEHLYEFQFGKRARDHKAPRYVMPEAFEPFRNAPAGIVDETTLDSLGLARGRSFFYWFDFGDDWWHRITVEAIDDEAPPGKYPRMVQRVGKNPPQYADWD